MPCYSRITTKMTNGSYLGTALRALGYTVDGEGDMLTASLDGTRINFTRSRGAYSATGDTSNLMGISKKYAEIGVRDFARKRGYTVEKAEGDRIVLVNRRG